MNDIINKTSDSTFISSFSSNFDSNTFLQNLNDIAMKAGKEIVSKGLLLYYILICEDIPFSIRVRIAGVLGYLILPFDLVPDFVVGFGYTDDLAALCYVVDQVQCYSTPEITSKVESKLKELFD